MATSSSNPVNASVPAVQQNLLFVQPINTDYIITEKSHLDKLRIGPIRKSKARGREYLSAKLLSERGGQPIIVTTPFQCSGIYHQDVNRAPNSTAPVNAVIRIAADANPKFIEILEALQRLVRLNIRKRAEEYQKANGENSFCEKLMSGDFEYMKPVCKDKDDQVMFIPCQPDMKVFILQQNGSLTAPINLQNMPELPRMGLYMMRVDTRFIYIGQHMSDMTSVCSISYRVNQVVFSPIAMATSPVELAMDISELKTQLMICEPPTTTPVHSMKELPQPPAAKKPKPAKPRGKVKENDNQVDEVNELDPFEGFM